MPDDPFAQLITDARSFLSDLTAQNNRDWFLDHKAQYDNTLKTPATLLLDQIAYDMRRVIGQTLTAKLFRAHRDVRFSKDKTPYHTHLHMMWSINGTEPVLFFGISPDYVRIGGGCMQFDKTALPDWRAAVAGPFGEQVQTLLSQLEKDGFVPDAPALKRIPAPFPKDHSNGALLRRKGLAVWADMPATDWANPTQTLNRAFARIAPLVTLLNKGF